VACTLLLLLLLTRGPSALDEQAAGGGTPANANVAPTASPLRGRSQELLAVVAPVETASPAPTDAPSAPPTAAPASTTGAVPAGTGTGGTGGGSGGGKGTGIGTGSGGASPTASPTPVPTQAPSPDPATTMILRGRVVDSRTGNGVPQTCVAPGLNTCAGQTVTFTDAGGYWQLVLSIGQNWDIKFLKSGYFVSEIKVPSQTGIHYVPDIRLRRGN